MDTATHFPEVDAEGYLVEPQEWNETIAKVLAEQENIVLNDDHWDVLNFMREYYAEHQITVDVRHVIKHLAIKHGPESRNMVFELFPYGYVSPYSRHAGASCLQFCTPV